MFNSNRSFHVLYTTNIEQTANFFQKLDITPLKHESDIVVVQFCGFELHYILNTTEPAEAYQYITTPSNYGHGAIFYAQINDLENAAEKIKDAGGMIKADIYKNHWGGEEFLLEDPNGYKFALYRK